MGGSCVVVVVVGLVFVSLLSCFVVVDCKGEECLEEERSLLLQLKNSMNLSSSNSLVSNWTGLNCCQWDGVYCINSTSRVHVLYLWNIREEEDGIWYPNVTMLAQFKELQYLYMYDNKMGGSDATLQALCKLPYLKGLDLSRNLLEGNIPYCFSDLKFLEFLNLRDNQLQGNIPSSIFRNMHSLRFLDLSHNQLRGIISPSTFANLHSLKDLALSDNQLQGTISPFTLSNLTIIETIDLSNNLLVGPSPFSMFANLSKLYCLDLTNNGQLEVETESPTWVPKFQLRNLFLANCKLNSHSGSVIPSFISTQHSLDYLDLTSTSLEGDIPSWFLYNSTQYQLMLQNNSLSGRFPLPYQNTTSSLQALDISNNFVYGPLPVNFVDIFPYLRYCDMSKNALQGNLPPAMGTVNLAWLALSNNNFSGKIPSSLMRGGFYYGLLDLSNNRLQGEMLPANSSMEGLIWLKLDSNEFTIPPNISKVPNLRILSIRNNHLSGKISSWLQVHHQLNVLFLGRNHFEGPIPWQICRMKSLRYLDLSHSNLGGTIPSCLASVPSWKSTTPPIYAFETVISNTLKDIPIDIITKGILYDYIGGPASLMTSIDLSMNKLSGPLPFEMGNMAGVRALNLSYNFLEGFLPVSFQNMKNLESLDLSHNNLNGTIPEEITELDFLSIFTVAFNNLSGEIPYRGKLLTFHDSSYEGNLGLCGKPLKKNCSSDEDRGGGGGGGGGEEHGILDSDLFFYSCIAISYCMGFWGFIAFLFFSKNSRRKFFITADAVQDWFFAKFWRIVCYFRSRYCN